MAIWSGLGTGARTAIVAAGTGVVAVGGWFTLSGQPQAPVSQTAPVAEAVIDAPEVAPEAAAAPAVVEGTGTDPAAAEIAAAPAPEPVPEPAPAAPAVVSEVAPDLPKFDVVRVEPDGSATIAGNAAAGALVSVRVDGAEVTTAAADASGKFAVLFTLPASSVPRLLSLATTSADGKIQIGPDTVALAPTVAAVVADATPVAPDAEDVAVLPAPPTALLVTESGVEVLQSGAAAAPEIAANVSIDTISYAPSGAVQLGGRGQGAAFVRLYLDGVNVATVPVAADGQWATVLADVAPGIYTLRADQIGADGKVTSRFETPFKRETLEALAAAAAPAPAAVAPEVASEVAAAEPVANPPAAVEPAAVEPAAVEPAAVEPAATEPAAAEPAAAEPAAAEPAAAEPAPVVAAAAAETGLAEQDPMAAAAPPADATAAAEAAPATEAAAELAPAAVDTALAVDVATAAPAIAAPATEPAPAAVETAAVETAAVETAAVETAAVETAVAAPAAAPALVSITVQPGFTLWGIAKAQMGDGVMYVQVFEANKDKIRDPDLIYPGQVFTMPAAN